MTDPEHDVPSDTGEGRRLPSISEMIDAHQKRTQDSLYKVVTKSQARTRGTSQKYLHDLLHGRAKSMPKNPATFTALADGLDTTELAILLGFAVEFGLPVRLPIFASKVPFETDDLPEGVTDALLAVLRSLTTGAPSRQYLPDDTVLTEAEEMEDDLDAMRNPSTEGSTAD